MKTYHGKRVFDVLLASLALIVLWPILLLITGLALVFNGRPILYRQTRLGVAGQKFTIYKFRTMVNGAHDQLTAVLHHYKQQRYNHRLPQDPRVTKLGKILRRWNVDELPQLFNILRGEMSFVGPRPAENYFCDDNNYLNQVKDLRPGLTGYYQIYSHTTDISSVDIRIESIAKYWQEISFLNDIKIILQTFRVVLKQKF